jgi:hypothetical protein
MVLLVCLPLIATKVSGYAALGLISIGSELGTWIGFAAALGYLVVFFPALVLFEPFAIIASTWYTRRLSYQEPVGPLLVCWFAVVVHTAVLISYLRLGR